MGLEEIIGFAGGALTTIAFLPQAVKAFRSKSTKDLSLPMYLLFTAGVFLWAAYGFLIESWPIITANSVVFVLALSVLALKFRYG